MKAKEIDILTKWEDLFYYSENSKSCLKHAVDKRTGRGFTRIVAFAHTDAGGIQNGYYTVRRNGKFYQAHRVVWELHNKRKLKKDEYIDHLNGDKLDNRIENLRIVTVSVNGRNRKLSSNNKTGINRVRIMTKNGLPNNIAAEWLNPDGTTGHKSYSINKYGYDNALKMATETISKMFKILIDLGENYTERHGK